MFSANVRDPCLVSVTEILRVYFQKCTEQGNCSVKSSTFPPAAHLYCSWKKVTDTFSADEIVQHISSLLNLFAEVTNQHADYLRTSDRSNFLLQAIWTGPGS